MLIDGDEPAPQMRLAFYVKEEPAAAGGPISVLALRADSPPREDVAAIRFVVELRGPRGPGRAVQTCVASIFETPPAAPPHPLLRLDDEREPAEWLEGTFRIVPGDSWSQVRFEGTRPFAFHSLDPSRYGIEDGGSYRVLVRLSVRTEPEVEKVLRGAEVVYDASICKLHHERMSLRPLPITWGSPTDGNFWPSAGPVAPDPEARAKFPHYLERLNGGCLVISDLPTTSIYICPACARAFQEWKAKRR